MESRGEYFIRAWIYKSHSTSKFTNSEVDARVIAEEYRRMYSDSEAGVIIQKGRRIVARWCYTRTFKGYLPPGDEYEWVLMEGKEDR